MRSRSFAAVMLVALIAGCGRAPAPYDAAAIVSYRAAKDAYMRERPESPFNSPTRVEFAPLKYFPVDPAWVFESKLQRLAVPEPVTILDTKGERRNGSLFGHVSFRRNGTTYQLRVYRMDGPAPGSYDYAIWFTDRTTGGETYDIGRYLDFDYDADSTHVYTIDFNRAYNPYCAYSSAYSCPIPPKEDHLDLAITAGEKKWH